MSYVVHSSCNKSRRVKVIMCIICNDACTLINYHGRCNRALLLQRSLAITWVCAPSVTLQPMCTTCVCCGRPVVSMMLSAINPSCWWLPVLQQCLACTACGGTAATTLEQRTSRAALNTARGGLGNTCKVPRQLSLVCCAPYRGINHTYGCHHTSSSVVYLTE